MSQNGIAKADDFRRAVERSNVERVTLPASGLSVMLCRPPVFAALEIGRTGTELQNRVTEAKPDEVKSEDVEAFTTWLGDTLARLFVEPRFALIPSAEEISLAELLIDDVKFIFRWLRGEVFTAREPGLGVSDTGEFPTPESPSPDPVTEDLGRFSERQGTDRVSGGSGAAKLLPSERTVGTHRHAGVPAGLHRR